MEYNTFIRKPFSVEAVEITKDNISEVAKIVGKLGTEDDGTPVIFADRRRFPNVPRVYIGFWMTKMENNIRCYSKKAFNNQFVATTPETETWLDIVKNYTNGKELE